MNEEKIILASGSFIRAQILKQAGYKFEVIKSSEHTEPSPSEMEEPARYVKRAAIAKGEEVSKKHPDRLVISADQVVEFEGRILRKVASLSEAKDRLLSFSNREHRLVGAWCLFKNGEVLDSEVSTVYMQMNDLSESEVDDYLAEENPLSSVACYFLEARGIRLIKNLKGSWFGALGLPLLEIQNALRKLDR